MNRKPPSRFGRGAFSFCCQVAVDRGSAGFGVGATLAGAPGSFAWMDSPSRRSGTNTAGTSGGGGTFCATTGGCSAGFVGALLTARGFAAGVERATCVEVRAVALTAGRCGAAR